MHTIKLYSDGGVRGNQNENNVGGYGAYLEFGNLVHEVKGGLINTTNNIMELKGCIEGLKAIQIKDLPVEVYLDSSYVLNGITSWIVNWKKNNWKTAKKEPVKNAELWIELDLEVSKFKHITFYKVKGHSGNFGNEQADRLCNEYMDLLEEQMNV